MSPRKLIALIEAQREIDDAELSRLGYLLKTGSLPPRAGDPNEEEEDEADEAWALHF